MDPFEYITALLSIIIGLGITHLLVGIGRMINSPTKIRVYWIHLLMILFVFIYMIFFWWFEFSLGKLEVWTFQIYLFLIFYAVLLFLACVILVPFHFPSDFKEYYYSKRKWLFIIVIAVTMMDTFDTLLKGIPHFVELGIGNIIFTGLSLSLCVVAIFTRKELFHALIVIVMNFYLILFAITEFKTL